MRWCSKTHPFYLILSSAAALYSPLRLTCSVVAPVPLRPSLNTQSALIVSSHMSDPALLKTTKQLHLINSYVPNYPLGIHYTNL